MPSRRPGPPKKLAAILLCMAVLPAHASEDPGDRPGRDPLYLRGEHRHRIEPAPRPAEVPESLRLDPDGEPFLPDPGEIDQEATVAGRWTAERMVRRIGRLVYYRAGFYDGTHLALDLRPEFPADYAEGLREGGRDPGALHHGGVAGTSVAEEVARIDAARTVEAQYMDLSTEPRFEPAAMPPPYRPEVPGIMPPDLDEVFRGLAADHVSGLSRTYSEAFQGWRLDPWRLHACRGYADFIEEWADAGDAFDFWLEGRRRSAAYRKLQMPADKQRFERIFRAAFSARLAMLYEEELALAYGTGRGDGWRFGAIAVAEWRYRQGYAAGFNQAAVTAAAASYAASFPGAYRRHYEDQFLTWSRTSRPGIVSFRVEDGSDDGIFEPGEEVLAWVELANYGGTAGSWRVEIEGDLLTTHAETIVQVPAREVRSPGQPLRLQLRREAEKGSRSEIRARLGDLRRSFPILVSYPLALTGNVDLEGIDVLDGRAVVEVEVINRSRRPVSGDVLLIPGRGLEAAPASVTLSALPPGGSRRASFGLEGIDPIAALAGHVAMSLELSVGETRHDEMEFTFPALALDPESRELERFLLALSMDEGPTDRAVRAALDLALERIAADWSAAVEGAGNPYKHDYEERDRTTALGALVRAFVKERPSIRNREIFARLGQEIEELVEDLPGVHPFLRKYAQRLARQLG